MSILGSLCALSVHWALFVFVLGASAFGWFNLQKTSKYNAEVWPQLYQNWIESWICHKCGSVYQQK